LSDIIGDGIHCGATRVDNDVGEAVVDRLALGNEPFPRLNPISQEWAISENQTRSDFLG
jgi:hypothetical protein